MYLLPLILSYHTQLCLITLRYLKVWKSKIHEEVLFTPHCSETRALSCQHHNKHNCMFPSYSWICSNCSAIQTTVTTPRTLNDLQYSSLKKYLYFYAHVNNFWKSTTKRRREWIGLGSWKIKPVNVWPPSRFRDRGLQIIHWKWTHSLCEVICRKPKGN